MPLLGYSAYEIALLTGGSDNTYMEYNRDLLRHYIRNYWGEVGTKFDDCGTKLVEISTKYNPEVIKYTP